jgi:predicted amidophosphoribosyltransferase
MCGLDKMYDSNALWHFVVIWIYITLMSQVFLKLKFYKEIDSTSLLLPWMS